MHAGSIGRRALALAIAAAIASLGLIATLSAPASAPSQTPAAPQGLDHFKCYAATGSRLKRREVALSDDFGRHRPTVVRLRTICNAVSMDGGRILNPRAHLACYELRQLIVTNSDPQGVRVTNNFGSTVLSPGADEILCVPSLQRKGTRAPADTLDPQRLLDHFDCHVGSGVDTASVVKLKDQFENTRARVGSPAYICNPAALDHGPVRRPKAHLICYSIVEAEGFEPVKVRLRNQFGVPRAVARKPSMLCLPSRTELIR